MTNRGGLPHPSAEGPGTPTRTGAFACRPLLADGGVWVRDDAGMAPSVPNTADGQVRGIYEASVTGGDGQ
ncbi:hypothetical protein ACH4CE_22285 [Streptomyces gelaticus]|uniref:hypothetical protein n=1 Tax=Streptomyces gelaticus TaxID=285446 RepID=UPI0037A6A242